jgi:hypothetical protein
MSKRTKPTKRTTKRSNATQDIPARSCLEGTTMDDLSAEILRYLREDDHAQILLPVEREALWKLVYASHDSPDLEALVRHIASVLWAMRTWQKSPHLKNRLADVFESVARDGLDIGCGGMSIAEARS